MLSVMLSEEEAREIAKDRVSIAAVNSTKMFVISGEEEKIKEIEGELKEKGIDSVRLKTSHAYHSRMMEGIYLPNCNKSPNLYWGLCIQSHRQKTYR